MCKRYFNAQINNLFSFYSDTSYIYRNQKIERVTYTGGSTSFRRNITLFCLAT